MVAAWWGKVHRGTWLWCRQRTKKSRQTVKGWALSHPAIVFFSWIWNLRKYIYIYVYWGFPFFFFLKTASDLFIFSNAKCLRASFLQAATPEQRSGKARLSTRPGGKQIQVTEAAGKVSSRQGTAIVAPSYRCLSYRFSCSNVVIQSTIANANKK